MECRNPPSHVCATSRRWSPGVWYRRAKCPERRPAMDTAAIAYRICKTAVSAVCHLRTSWPPICDSNDVCFRQPDVIVIAVDHLKSVSECGDCVTERYPHLRICAGLAGMQAHFTVEESGKVARPMLGATSVPCDHLRLRWQERELDVLQDDGVVSLGLEQCEGLSRQ